MEFVWGFDVPNGDLDGGRNTFGLGVELSVTLVPKGEELGAALANGEDDVFVFC